MKTNGTSSAGALREEAAARPRRGAAGAEGEEPPVPVMEHDPNGVSDIKQVCKDLMESEGMQAKTVNEARSSLLAALLDGM